jgi:hypothetical protein
MIKAPQEDIDALERHRVEAKRYLPDIQKGTDPYISRWFDCSLWALAAIVCLVLLAEQLL